MLLAIDIGNTNTVLGLYRSAELVTDWRIRTEQDMTADEYGILMNNLFAAKNFQFKDVSHMVASWSWPLAVESASMKGLRASSSALA